jgi:hypothetical protein
MIQNSTIVNSNDKLTFKLKGVNESGEQETVWLEELIDIMYDLMWENKNVYISMAYQGDEDNIVEITLKEVNRGVASLSACAGLQAQRARLT